ncbi:MAG: T9SS type A sorting domain-containing protein, partial [Tannerella sp.]|nr:T9SS type A sorting domain-containing protein [Tannerella sp.]
DSLTIYGNVDLRAAFVPAGSEMDPGKNTIVADDDSETGDKVWAYEETLYVRTQKGVTVRVYTPDGVLHHVFVTATAGLTTRSHFVPGIYIVTLDGGAGRKVTIHD